MRRIKLFESFKNDDNEDYIVNSIRDILIELEDNGMIVDIYYTPLDFRYDKPSYVLAPQKKTIIQPVVTIEIKGSVIDTDVFYDIYEEFEVSSIRDYIDTVVDFMEGIWPSYSLYFGKYDVEGDILEDDKVLKDGKCGSIVIQIHKKEI